MYVSGLGKVDNRICIVREWTPEEASLLQDRPFLLQLSREQDTRLDTCACIIHTINLQLHVQFIIIETLHDQSVSLMASEDSLRDSKPPVTGWPRTKGQES